MNHCLPGISLLLLSASHLAGADLLAAHVEKYSGPTITRADLAAGEPFRFPSDRPPHVVVMIGEDEYRTWETLPAFAKTELEPRGLRASIVQQNPQDKNDFPGLVEALARADLLVVSVRRRTPLKLQLDAIRSHLAAGKPLVGIRTASHAFAARAEDKTALAQNPKLGDWPDFDPAVLGGNYRGHYGAEVQTKITRAPGAETHPILKGIDADKMIGHGSLYRVSPLAESTTWLLLGSIPGQPAEPVAWTHTCGPKNARVFYTSLGHPDDFADPEFRRLLVNATRWALGQPTPPKEPGTQP